MIKSRVAMLLVFVAFVGGGAGGCHTVGRNIAGVGNFAEVDDGLYRGAQPTAAGIATLQGKGIRTVIDLRDDANPAERAWVESRGIGYVRIPCDASVVEPQKISLFLQQVATAPRPAFVHCQMGRDRTGLDVAVYRIVVQGWPRQRAIRELYAHGYNWLLFPGIARYVRVFDIGGFRSTEVLAGGG
jgi:tyrosine-protein phosphatase SIW14